MWERKFIPFGGGKIASPTRSLLLQLGAALGFTLSAALLLTLCAAPVDVDPTPVPTANATAIHETAIACAWIDATNTAVAATQTAMAVIPTETPLPNWLQPDYLQETHYSNLRFLNDWIQDNQLWLRENGYPLDPTYWQNHYNQDILNFAATNGVPPSLLHGLLLKESHSALNPESLDATGIAQITLDGFDQAFRYNPNSSRYIQLAYQYAINSGTAGRNGFPTYDSQIYSSYQDYYLRALNEQQKAVLRIEAQKAVDGMCYPADVSINQCNSEDLSSPLLEEGSASIELAAQILNESKRQLIDSIGQVIWDTLPKTEQWKMVAAAYNGGVGCVSSSFSAAQAANTTPIQSWEQVKPHLGNNCTAPQDTERYPDIVECYATGTGDVSCQ